MLSVSARKDPDGALIEREDWRELVRAVGSIADGPRTNAEPAVSAEREQLNAEY